MDGPRPVILELAVNGSTPRSANRHVPRTPAEVTTAMLDGVAGGASVLHNHTDDPMFTASGVHALAPYLEAWTPVLERHPGVLLYPTMAAGARGVAVTERWGHVEALAPLGGLALVDPGSVNVGLTEDGEVPDDAAPGPYANSYADTAHMFARAAALGVGSSISVFEPGFLRTTLAWQRAGRLPAGAMVKLYFGGRLAFGLPPTVAGLEAYLELLEPSGLPWSVAVLGGDVVASGLAALALERGGHLRVGLEDHAGPGEPTNAELLADAVALVEDHGHRAATPAETRTLLGLAPA
ncbi:3-keto-5-aminohexanoate cleavage protein [Nocardioides lentus]|uniref:3-keto-5-aminohexanoate cleavage protein n=1 Tax=Nocardioides lentus TaxID=338077 RepID=A0ABN2P601_9ACTN